METRISKNLKYLRESRNWAKSLVADKIGKTNTTIRDYETGKAKPPYPILIKYAQLFDIRAGRLLDEDLWLGEGSDPNAGERAPDERLLREKELLHDRLDDREAEIARLRAEVLAVAKQLQRDPALKEHYLAISQLLEKVEKDQ